MKFFYYTFLMLTIGTLHGQIVSIPDANFKNALVNEAVIDVNSDGIGDIDVDSNDDGEIQVSEAEATANLIINSWNIDSLEGIQSFVNLEILNCWGNNLETIEVSSLTNLKRLQLGNNQITSIDVTQLPLLENLDLWSNELSSLDIAQNPLLDTLILTANNLTELNLSNNSNLLWLDVKGNQLSELDVSNMSLLIFDCDFNELTALDLSNHTSLAQLGCSSNQLESLNIKNGNNANFFRINTTSNPNLNCIEVDDSDYANNQDCDNNNWCKDDHTAYSEKCSLGLTDIYEKTISLYPNPAQNTLTINTEIGYIKIYSLQGQLIKNVTESTIDVSLLSPGIYFVSVSKNGQTITKQFIKS